MVRGIRVEGDRATASVTLTPRIPGEVELRRRDGRWRLLDVRVTPVPERSTLAIAGRAGDDLAVWDLTGGKRFECPPVTRIDTEGDAAVDGGCAFGVTSKAAPLIVSTLFGDQRLATCRGLFRFHVLPPRQVVFDHVLFGGPGACRSTSRCRHGETGLTYPWQGERLARPDGESAIRVDLCVNTPAGRIRGLQMLELEDRGGDARLRPYDHPAGASSVRLLGSWDVRPDRLRLGGLRAPPRSGR